MRQDVTVVLFGLLSLIPIRWRDERLVVGAGAGL